MATIVLPETERPAGNATLVEGCLLVGIAAMVLRKAVDGQLQLYVHPRYTVFVTIAAIVLLVIGEIRLLQRSRSDRSARRKIGVYGLLLLPLVLGMLVPARPADTAQRPLRITPSRTAQVVLGASGAERDAVAQPNDLHLCRSATDQVEVYSTMTTTTPLPQQVEEAALNAWPALQQIVYDGWLLRFADGYTKRANSVTPLHASQIELAEKIKFCEQSYAYQQLPCIFRLPSFAASPLDDLLAQRGYEQVDQTLVLHRALHTLAAANHIAIRHDTLDRWLATFCRLSHTTPDQHQQHHMLLQHITQQPLWATLEVDDEPVACGMGVLQAPLFGLFDIVTARGQRNRGYGTQLVQAMLWWAAQHGATQAYLQVVTHNAAAQHVYAKLGFAQLYRYWYRIAPH